MFLTGKTNRTPGPAGPVVHAVSDRLPRANKRGDRFVAVCGSPQVAVVLHSTPFAEWEGHACRKCTAAVNNLERARLDAEIDAALGLDDPPR